MASYFVLLLGVNHLFTRQQSVRRDLKSQRTLIWQHKLFWKIHFISVFSYNIWTRCWVGEFSDQNSQSSLAVKFLRYESKRDWGRSRPESTSQNKAQIAQCVKGANALRPKRMFTQCSTHPGSLGLPMSKYGHSGTKKEHFGGFQGPPMTFLCGLKGPNWPPRMWRTMFNPVHPMFNPFKFAGTAYGQIWPFWAKKSHNMAIMAIKYGKWWPSRLDTS